VLQYTVTSSGLWPDSGAAKSIAADHCSIERISNRQRPLNGLPVLQILRIQEGASSEQRRNDDRRVVKREAVALGYCRAALMRCDRQRGRWRRCETERATSASSPSQTNASPQTMANKCEYGQELFAPGHALLLRELVTDKVQLLLGLRIWFHGPVTRTLGPN
jgi:hypothetical protein